MRRLARIEHDGWINGWIMNEWKETFVVLEARRSQVRAEA